MKTVLKSVLVTAVTLVPVLALASEVRVTGMGRSAGVDDDAYTFTYPSLAANYSLITAQVGDPNFGEAHLVTYFTLGDHHLGLAFNRKQSLFTHLNATSRSSDGVDFLSSYLLRYSFERKLYQGLDASPERPVDLFYALPMGTSALGIRLTLASLLESTDGPFHDSKTGKQFDATLGYNMSVGDSRLDVGLKFGILGTVDVKQDTAAGSSKDVSISRGVDPSLSLRFSDTSKNSVRTFYTFNLDFHRPHITRSNGTADDSALGKEYSGALSGGVNFNPTDKVLLSGGLGSYFKLSEGPYVLAAADANTTLAKSLRGGTEKVTLEFGKKTNQRAYGIVANGGGEAMVADHWGMLVGVEYVLWGLVDTSYPFESGEPRYKSNPLATTDDDLWQFGLVYKTDVFRVDGILGIENLLHSGPYFVTGTASAKFIGQCSATYQF